MKVLAIFISSLMSLSVSAKAICPKTFAMSGNRAVALATGQGNFAHQSVPKSGDFPAQAQPGVRRHK